MYTGSIHPFNLCSAGAMVSFDGAIEDKNSSPFISATDNFLPVWHYGSALSYLFRSLLSVIFKELTRYNISLDLLWAGQGSPCLRFHQQVQTSPPLCSHALHYYTFSNISIFYVLTSCALSPYELLPSFGCLRNSDLPWPQWITFTYCAQSALC